MRKSWYESFNFSTVSLLFTKSSYIKWVFKRLQRQTGSFTKQVLFLNINKDRSKVGTCKSPGASFINSHLDHFHSHICQFSHQCSYRGAVCKIINAEPCWWLLDSKNAFAMFCCSSFTLYLISRNICQVWQLLFGWNQASVVHPLIWEQRGAALCQPKPARFIG